MARTRFDCVGEVSHDVGVADVHADADVGAVEVVLDQRHQRVRVGQRVGDHLERQLDARLVGDRVELFDTASRGVAAVV